MPISPSRAAAFDVLMRIEMTDAYASELLHSPRFAKLLPSDHALLTELVMGVLRWRSTLDGVIAGHLSTALARTDLEVLTALRLGAYQLLFLDRIPARAAINESVELTKRAHKRSATGMVNAVLRKISEGGRQSSQLTPRSAHPDWMVERWSANYGIDKEAAICEYDQRPPMPVVRITDSAIVKELEQSGIRTEAAGLLAKAYRITAGDITTPKAFRDRRVNIQDEASQLVALLVGEGKSILDCCAAPGGKTRIIADRNPNAEIVALELHPHRAALLRKLVHEPRVRVIAADARAIPLGETFERVLVDAPCSGTGTLARNPEIKWRLKADDLPRIQQYQMDILRSAMQFVSAGGRLVYSTCSLEVEENEHVIKRAAASDSSFTVMDCRTELEKLQASGELTDIDLSSLLSGAYLRTIPGVHRCEGFFAAILEKR